MKSPACSHRTNIVKAAVRIIVGSDIQKVSHAAKIIGGNALERPTPRSLQATHRGHIIQRLEGTRRGSAVGVRQGETHRNCTASMRALNALPRRRFYRTFNKR